MKSLMFMFFILCSPLALGFIEVLERGVVSQGFFGETSIVINGQRAMVSSEVIIRDTSGNQVRIIPANSTIQFERVDSSEPNTPINLIWIVE